MYRAHFRRHVDRAFTSHHFVGSDRKRVADRLLQVADPQWRKELAVRLAPWVEGRDKGVIDIVKSFKGLGGEVITIADDVEMV